jgi:hypothetical protein
VLLNFFSIAQEIVLEHSRGETFCFHRVYCIHDFSEKLNSSFFFEYFRTYFIEQVNKYSAKGSVDSVRYDMIALMNIPLPTFEEQKQIAKILTTQDKKIEIEETNLDKLKELKKGLIEIQKAAKSASDTANSLDGRIKKGDFDFKDEVKNLSEKTDRLLEKLGDVAAASNTMINDINKNPSAVIFDSSSIPAGPGEDR